MTFLQDGDLKEKTAGSFAKVYTFSIHFFYITEEEISGEALLAITKNDIKEIGVELMGRRIQLRQK